MLFGKLVRSAVPHARLRGVDTRAAAAMPGVRAIVGAADVPAARYGSSSRTWRCSPPQVLFVGQPIAGVVADSFEAAEAARAVVVDYEELPAVLDVEAACLPDVPLLHEDWQEYQAAPTLDRDGNVSNRAALVLGDVEAGFAQCAHIFEHRFATSVVHPGYTEPRAALADWDESGRLTVWSNTQLPFEIAGDACRVFQARSLAGAGRRHRRRWRLRRQAAAGA